MANASIFSAFERMWQHVTVALGNKVDKVSGKSLSTNDFTDEYKTKLDNIESGTSGNIVIDDAISGTSTNPVQNKVIREYIESTVNSLNFGFAFSEDDMENSNFETAVTLAVNGELESVINGSY